MFEFLESSEHSTADGSWFRASAPWLDDSELLFRPTYYQGSRDTDPRAASAHVVTLPSNGSTTEAVLINVHMATLRSEAAGQRPLAPGDELAFSLRSPSAEAIYLRHRQFEVLSAFVDWVYSRLRLPVIVAGDFNCEPGSPEMVLFCRSAALVPALRSDVCWRCGSSEARRPQRRYANAAFTRVADRADSNDPEEDPLLPVTSAGYCGVPSCAAPRFTHRRNLLLLDNILATDPASGIGKSLTTQIAFAPSPGSGVTAGINDTHGFSDHNSVWATFTAVG
jgi:hypothetical protein